MKSLKLVLLLGLILCASSACADVTFELVCAGWGTAVSADGTVIAGNSEWYETFRWSEADGFQLLGMSSYAHLGIGAGSPDISADGTRISSTILGADSTYATQGVWTLGEGWAECMPPLPADGGIMDNAYGSAWGISGDGEAVLGLYWRPGHVETGLAHASHWTEGTGVVDLGSSGNDSRANDANWDGSVVVGWDAADFGFWRPAVWVDGVMTLLGDYEAWCQATTVTPDGTMIAGLAFDPDTSYHPAAVWRWDGNVWVEEILGYLPGTVPYNGEVIAFDMTDDGSLIVGYNMYANPWTATGFMWTQETGIIDVEDYLEDNGVAIPVGFEISSLQAVSSDGSTMVGVGQYTSPPYAAWTFIIRSDVNTAVPELGAGATDVARVRARTNPAIGDARLALSLAESGRVDLSIFDVKGRLVRGLLSEFMQAGEQEVYWDGRDQNGRAVPSGVYFYRLESDGRSEAHKLIMMR